jgi:3-phenylpropionate/cinnamic acid dioxygenase small subunit
MISDIERVSAELAIRNLIAKIFILTDTAPDFDAYAQCFTEDAIWERVGEGAEERLGAHLGARASGRAGIVADRLAVRATKANGPEAASWHMATNVAVSVEGRDAATAWTTWIYVAKDGAAQKISSAGFYRDEFRRTDDGWRLARRRYSMGKPPVELSPAF